MTFNDLCVQTSLNEKFVSSQCYIHLNWANKKSQNDSRNPILKFQFMMYTILPQEKWQNNSLKNYRKNGDPCDFSEDPTDRGSLGQGSADP